MTGVIFDVNEDDKSFWHTVDRLLAKPYRLFSCYGGKILARPRYPDLFLAGAQSLGEISVHNSIVVYRDLLNPRLLISHSGQAVAIVDSANAAAVDHVAALQLPAITCGLSARDTITLSSIGSERAMINLQRAFHCIGGARVDPLETPVAITDAMDPYAVMASAAVCLLCGLPTEQLSLAIAANPSDPSPTVR
ncbi:hypothetical protein LJC63_06655 [Ruminococcaceae bacterium OttesenSCG-928-L11]|nr:hypothetical protein [Ruminococcaceae bacterium OttesenSCG-928-L11]